MPEIQSISESKRRSGILVEFVTDAPHGQNVVRIFWIGFQLFAEPVDVRIDVALISFILRAPHAIEQIIARPGAARFRRQQLKYLKLERREIDPGTSA